MCFSFTKAAHMKSVEIRMDKSAFYSTEYIKDFHVENLSFWHSRLPKLYDIRKCHPTTVLPEFAVYKNIETLQKRYNDIDIDEYDKQGKSYTCISAVIKPYQNNLKKSAIRIQKKE